MSESHVFTVVDRRHTKDGIAGEAVVDGELVYVPPVSEETHAQIGALLAGFKRQLEEQKK